ncbi:nucleoside deaminase [Salinimicrobium sediminilitoris]|uniref:nucleoside deaminase n=1 Tax=Salinimicrobium sediminilitoris TaxID=2876715 RepID=UPI001E3F6D4A|nr:nucleoside deaminase [Salinimicrobium sediminilitoris]MCC8360415.1 nucleoside deaminase [Salinimicrobium sediminilitoris]
MKNSQETFTKQDIEHLKHCLALAEEALNAGDEPFGSILVNQKNEVIAEARNRVNEINKLAHPEIELAHWAAVNLSEEEREHTTMYTSGEHCPMCAAAHGWVELGTIVYLSSADQLSQWLQEVDASPPPVNNIPIQDIIKLTKIKGPFEGELLQKIKDLQLRYHHKTL